MSIYYQIPPQSRMVNTSTIFSAVFNAVTPGRYDFTGTTACQNVDVFKTIPGTMYLIERMNAGGNVSEDDFLSSIITFPLIALRKKKSGESILSGNVPVTNYFKGLETATWFYSDKQDDYLTLSLSGLFCQTPAMVGLSPLQVQISMVIFAIESSYFNKFFRDQLRPSIGRGNVA